MSSSPSSDELAVINGVKPNLYLKDGDEKEVNSTSSSSKYKIKRTWDHYYCTCPAWRNQGGVPVNARSCKHLQSLLGMEYEIERAKLKNPDGPIPGQKNKKVPAKGKRKKDDDDDDEEEDDGGRKSKRSKPSSSSKPISKTQITVAVLLANKWDIEKGTDPTGWWMSEKLDGVRTYYNGTSFYSRLGNLFSAPKWFLEKLPKDVTLDGELFTKRGDFQSTVSIVKTANSPHWNNITLQVFDIPSMTKAPFEKRMEELKKLFGPGGKYACKQVNVVDHTKVTSRQQVLDELKKVESMGGEGLMLRKAGSLYEPTRSSTLLKIKTFYDAEAVVTGYNPGSGRHKGQTGSLKCKMESGKTFSVGSGLSDAQRKKPPKVGTIITYRFQEVTKDGVPRFPTFVGVAVDKDKPKDAEVPDHRKAGAAKAEKDD